MIYLNPSSRLYSVQIVQRRLDIDPERPELGKLCEYCMLRNFDATSIVFTDFNHYQSHVIRNHPSYSIYAFDEDLQRFANSLPFGNDYQKKLAHKMKLQLEGRPVRITSKPVVKANKHLQMIKQREIEARKAHDKLIQEWMNEH